MSLHALHVHSGIKPRRGKQSMEDGVDESAVRRILPDAWIAAIVSCRTEWKTQVASSEVVCRDVQEPW